MNSETVDLIATDPPFNKSRDFHATPDSLAAGASFQDRWSWDLDVHETWIDQLKDGHRNLYLAIENARKLHSDSMGAYLCFMAVRLIAMRRLLKPTGSIYLHCDPTASHYLKMLMDAIFGLKNFRNEIVWHYRGAGTPKKDFARRHDIILRYSKKTRDYYFDPDPARQPYAQATVERFSHYIGNVRDGVDYGQQELNPLGKHPDDVITDIQPIAPSSRDRSGYPTQKPLELYERIIEASSNKDDMVLDPFAGCATTCVAAEKLGRQWVGIDIWDKSPDVILDRLEKEGLKAPKYTRKSKKSRQQYLFADEFTFTSELPERTDNEEVAVAALPTLKRALLEPWQRMSNAEMRAVLEDAQANEQGWIVCAGCGRELEAPFMELDHIMPKAELGVDDISNRILLCGPCNLRKSDQKTLNGLRSENKNKEIGWMWDEEAALLAQRKAKNRVIELRNSASLAIKFKSQS